MSEAVDVLEALLFASDAPIEAERIQEVLELDSPAAARELADALRRRLDGEGRALQVLEVGGGFRLVTRPEVAPWLVKLQRSKTNDVSRLIYALGIRHVGEKAATTLARYFRTMDAVMDAASETLQTAPEIGRSSTRPRASSSSPSACAT